MRPRPGRACVALGIVLASCTPQPKTPTHPPAEVYEAPSDFTGRWTGEIGGLHGTLKISELGNGRFYGRYRGDGGRVQYSLAMEQLRAKGPGGAERPSNLLTFSWQDGRGGLGGGWLLINRDDSALTGEFGRGSERTTGLGEWTFIRVDE